MKEFLLKNKWLGFVALLVYALVAASVVSKYGNALVKQYTPVVTQEAAQFLPVTFQNGEIVAPQNTIISQSYGFSDNNEADKINVVLNTNVDEFEATQLNENGIYFSKKYMYVVSPRKTEIQSYKDVPDGTFDEETLKAGAEGFVSATQKYLFPVYTVVCLVLAMIAVLIYTVLMHWLMAILFKVQFGNTLRVNTLTYAIIGIVEVLGGLSVGFLLMFGVLLVINVLVNSLNKTAPAMA